MIRLIDADALKRRLIKRREEIASERRYGWEWEYNGLNCAILLTGCEAVENPIRPEPHWIPVTERLPEGIGRVIAQMDGGAIHDVFYKGKNPYGHVVWVRLDDCIYWDNEVVAWMPLPEPYKGVTE